MIVNDDIELDLEPPYIYGEIPEPKTLEALQNSVEGVEWP